MKFELVEYKTIGFGLVLPHGIWAGSPLCEEMIQYCKDNDCSFGKITIFRTEKDRVAFLLRFS